MFFNKPTFVFQGIKDIKKPLDQSLTMIKSAALFAQKKLHIHVFTEEDMKPLFEGKIIIWGVCSA